MVAKLIASQAVPVLSEPSPLLTTMMPGFLAIFL
jgi:hypothetical protein